MSDPAVVEVVDGIARTLFDLGVRTAFGMPGGDSLPLIRALEAVGVRFVLVRDEASAGFAADATAQLTGTVGLCVSTLGPGLTNLVSGVAGCTLDRAPVLAVTSRYRTDRHGTYTHMMLDQTKLLDATGKAWFRMTAANASGELRRALAIARAPRPGAVWLEVPTEVATAPWDGGFAQPPPAAEPTAVPEAVARTLVSWSRPVILAGLGALDADVAALAEALRAPVLTSYKAKGVVPERAGWAAGAAGLSPIVDGEHRSLVDQADGLLLVGWDPVELRDHWLPGWRVDANGPAIVALDSAWPTDLPTRLDRVHVGDVPNAVAALARSVGARGSSTWARSEVAAHRATVDEHLQDGPRGPATAIRATQAAVDGFDGDVVVTLDVGAHRITASNVWRCSRPHRLLQSNGWASMGYGMPAGLAAVAAGHPAVVLTGDMGLQLVLGELGTARELGGTLVVVVLLDESLSLIELKQERLGHPSAGVRFGNPDLSMLAAAFGGQGVEVEGPDAATHAVSAALQSGGLHIVGIRIDPAGYRRQM